MTHDLPGFSGFPGGPTDDVPESAKTWVLMYEVRATGERFCGSPTTYASAKAWADWLNKDCPHLHHWPEPIPDLPATLLTPTPDA